ncbi:response regulator [Paenibacillus pinisoli]|uniref:Response regulator n=1 Tax=Paenibacillus pinisoli TaxID=1276110 RepID=A0A3A6PQG5_9BACL|nr:response regulator [Paenibacillus pinisoli]RJX38861.1 response regulator [Paenibacillus pinisoli]
MNERIKVLIADDESIVRKGLRATVNWSDFRMEVVDDVPNGRKAWESFLEHRPEVVITDIVMPEMDGIELTRKIKELAPHTKILLLSCHRDFEYAQQGIKLGVAGYLLKTAFEDEEMERLLGGFRDELSAEAAAPRESKAAGRLDDLFCAWLFGAHNEAEFLEGLRQRWAAEWSWMEGGHEVYLLQQEEGLGELAHSLAEKPRAAALLCGHNRCYLVFAPGLKEELDALLMERLGKDSSFRWYKEGAQRGMEGWLRTVRSLHAKAERDRSYGIHAESWPEALQKAVAIVAQDLRYPWSVSNVADRVGLSRSHFSTLFKKVSGENFVDFIHRMRLRAARDMLAHTTLTQQDIAEHIGLIDGKYFSKWFKRSSGMTPSQYRGQQKGES